MAWGQDNAPRIDIEIGILPRLCVREGGSDSTVTNNGKMRIPNEKNYFTKENKMSRCRKPVTTDPPVRTEQSPLESLSHYLTM